MTIFIVSDLFRYFFGSLINQCECLEGFYGAHCEIASGSEAELDKGRATFVHQLNGLKRQYNDSMAGIPSQL